MKVSLSRRCVAEAIGTFAIVFFGCGTITALSQGDKHLIVNIVFGLTVAVSIYALGHISKAHFNPAVTIAFAVIKRHSWKDVIPYCSAQLFGSLAACFIVSQVFSRVDGASTPNVSFGLAILVETTISFFLMLVIVSIATDDRSPREFAGAAIGMTVTLCGLFAGPVTGCSMNPARSIGPAIFTPSYQFQLLLIYIIGPIFGAILAATFYEWLKRTETH